MNLRTFVTRLLGCYHGKSDLSKMSDFKLSEAQRDYLVSCGLGPIVFDLISRRTEPQSLIDDDAQTFRSAHLTSWVIHRQMQNATLEILLFATAAGIDVVLLKGISISDEFYRSPHHRLMGDIDLLVHEADGPKFNALLLSRGYVVRSLADGPRTPVGHHHLPELKHPETGVSVEIHTSLFSRTMLAKEALLMPQEFLRETRPSVFQNAPCLRFSPEYQLVYTLMHWTIDYKWPVNVISINDLVYLVHRENSPPDWRRVAEWMGEFVIFGDVLTTFLTYMQDCGLVDVPPELGAEIAASRQRLGRSNLMILHWLLRTFPLSGRRKVGWVMTRFNARVIWLTLLEPRPKYLRPLVALSRVLFRRTRGKSLLGSVPGRIRTLLQPNA